jgi:REP element-mobilizing transposase RayT
MRKTKDLQIDLFPKKSKSYGGILLKKRKNRTYARPISTSQTMHLVLRSSKAIGEKSFKTSQNQKYIQNIIAKFSIKYGIRIISLANVGNHLHLHVKIAKRAGYLCFIRAVTAAIAMRVSGRNRWSVKKSSNERNSMNGKEKFWDYRPFTRIVEGFHALLNMRDYIQINQLEGLGVSRLQARMMLTNQRPKMC